MRAPARVALLVLAAAGVLGWRAASAAQRLEPLRKADLIRLLSERALSTRDIASLVRRNCLSFRPSERDQADLRAVGADAEVLRSVSECEARRASAAAQSPRGRGGAEAAGSVAPLRAVPMASRVSGTVGTEVLVRVQVRRGTLGQAGMRLVLRRSGAPPSGLDADAEATTDARGFATFRVLVGTVAGPHGLTVAAAAGGGGALENNPVIELTALPGPPATAAVEPSRLELRGGSNDAPPPVRVTLRDRFANPVPGRVVELRPARADAVGGPSLTGTTDRAGQATFDLRASPLLRSGEIGVYVGGERLGVLAVVAGPRTVSRVLTGFRAGSGSRGVVATTLAEPLVFEVLDPSGLPLVGEPVSFLATGARVAPPSAPTDSAGRVRVAVTFGERAGSAVVSATVRDVRMDTTLVVAPGSAIELVVEYRGERVPARMTVHRGEPVLLRVSGRDAYGNQVPVPRYYASVEGQLAVQDVWMDAGGGTVMLSPARSGRGVLRITAEALQTTVAIEVALPTARLPSPGLWRNWGLGGRVNWAAWDYSYAGQRTFDGQSGALAQAFVERVVASGLKVVGAVGGGLLNADSSGFHVRVTLVEAYAGAEYAFGRESSVRPVLTAGLGAFRLRTSGSPGAGVHHRNLLWLVGGGVDVTLSPRLVGGLRIVTHQLNEVTNKTANGHVGSLLVVGAGLHYYAP